MFLAIFVGFNLLMLTWFVLMIAHDASRVLEATSEAESTAEILSSSFGTLVFLAQWVVGDIILGLPVLIAGKPVVVTVNDEQKERRWGYSPPPGR